MLNRLFGVRNQREGERMQGEVEGAMLNRLFGVRNQREGERMQGEVEGAMKVIQVSHAFIKIGQKVGREGKKE
jgi:hypothetical protein